MLNTDFYNTQREIFLNVKKPIKLFPLGDCHIGAPQWKREFFYAYVDYIKSLKTARVIGMGDYLDFGTKNRFNSAYAQSLRNCEQKCEMEDIFKELKKKVIGILPGNHEWRAMDYDVNLTGDMARYANVPLFAHKAHVHINVAGSPYHILAQHGTTNSRYWWTTVSAVVRELQHYDFDLAFYGHTHKVGNYDQTVIRSGKTTGTQHYYLTGSFLDYFGGYAEEKALPIQIPAQVCVNIGKNRVSHEIFREVDFIEEIL